MKTLYDIVVHNKRVLVRCDFNVPLDAKHNIIDDFKIQKSLPTIRFLVRAGAKVILMSHLGSPKGVWNVAMSLLPIKKRLEELLLLPIQFADDCIGPEAEVSVNNLQVGEILLLENVRFHEGEEKNDPVFAQKLARLADVYINDAFAESHRAYASMVGVPAIVPHGAGLLLLEERENLSRILQNPNRPLVAILGGKKVETKASFIKNILNVADTVMVSGLIQQEIINEKLSFPHQEKILHPERYLLSPDIHDEAIDLFTQAIQSAKTIVWNGPFGKIEDPAYRKGTRVIAEAIIKSKAFSVVGGGETIAFLKKEGLLDRFHHVSTGGGAMLDFLSGETLPGLAVLE